jgi:hypothetical protein
MASEGDVQRVHALAHDAYLRTMVGPDGPSDDEFAIIKEELGLSERLLGESPADADRARVRGIVHPSTKSNFLTDL